MLADMDRRPGRAEPRVVARDAGLERVSVLTRWLGVSAVGLVGLLAGYVWQSKPGGSTGQPRERIHARTGANTQSWTPAGARLWRRRQQPPVSAVGPTSVGSGGS